jgi:hypothetical protein
MEQFNGIILSPDYKLFLASIYFAGVLTGGIIGAIVLSIKEAQFRERENR